MPLKHPLRGYRVGGHWLRQATVLGLGIGLLAGTGLIATASAASAHSDAARASAGHRPARACAVIVGRPGQARVRAQRCLPGVPVAVPVCRLELRPARARALPPRSVRLAIPKRLPPVLRVRPDKRLRPIWVQRVQPAKRPRLQLVRPGRLPRPIWVQQVLPGKRPGRLRLSRLRAQAPVAIQTPMRIRAPVAVQAPVMIRGSACPPRPVLRIRPGQVRLCRVVRAKQASAARCCVVVARPQRLPRPGRLRLQVPVRACAIAGPVRLVPAPRR